MADNPTGNTCQCALPDPDKFPPKLLYHCTRCGSVYRRGRITRRWIVIQHGTKLI